MANLLTGEIKRDETIYDLAYKGKTAAVKILLDENPKLVTQPDDNGRMLIHWAALGGHDDLLQHLLSLKSPVDPTDDSDLTPLILAASGGRDKVVDTLLSEGANVNHKAHDDHSALQHAASKNWKSICANLIEKGADVNIADNRGATPLHRAASKGNIAIVQLLLDCASLKIDNRDVYGNSALHLACEEDRQDIAKMLVAKGADLELTNKGKQTPLNLASLGLARQLRDLKESLAKKE